MKLGTERNWHCIFAGAEERLHASKPTEARRDCLGEQGWCTDCQGVVVSQPSHYSELSDLGQVNLSAPPFHPPPIFKRRGLGSLQVHSAVVLLYCELRKGPKVLVLQVQGYTRLNHVYSTRVSINWLSSGKKCYHFMEE